MLLDGKTTKHLYMHGNGRKFASSSLIGLAIVTGLYITNYQVIRT